MKEANHKNQTNIPSQEGGYVSSSIVISPNRERVEGARILDFGNFAKFSSGNMAKNLDCAGKWYCSRMMVAKYLSAESAEIKYS